MTKYIERPAINSWQKKVKKNKNVIPKSGCKIISPDIIINEITKAIKYDILPLIAWTINHALKIK